MTPYHRGELAAQERAGLRDEAERLAPMIRSEIPAAVADFLTEQPMLVVGAVDPSGAVWATALTGFPGFLSVPSPSTLEVAASPRSGDPLRQALDEPTRVGLLAIEPGARRRVRMNGLSHPTPDGFLIDLDQVYPNCPKYIQRREPKWATAEPSRPESSTELSAEDREFATSVDTFFIATADQSGNADVSHRGGNPGFLRALSPTHLQWPDYTGNSMFNTLGNLEVNPRAGILLSDWTTGTFVHLTGTAVVDWAPEHAATVPGAQRLVDFTIERIVRIADASSLRWSDPEFSRFNPSPAH